MLKNVFKNTTAIVTGGASGIGSALSVELAQHGCNVIIADLQMDLAKRVLKSIQSMGGKASVESLDVTRYSDVDALVKSVVARTGKLDFMFNNAGIGIGGPAYKHAMEDWKQIIDVNLMGVIHGVQAAYPLMKAQGHGHIINTASTAGIMPTPVAISYAMTKHAVFGLSTSLRPEAASFGVRVSVICPGVVRTPILENCGKFGKMLTDVPVERQLKLWEQLKPMDPKAFARKALAEVAENKGIIVIPSWWKWAWRFNALFPAAGLWLARKIFDDYQKRIQKG